MVEISRLYRLDNISDIEELGLEENPQIPLLGMVSRLVSQKGLDLLIGCLGSILKTKVQLVILGMGDLRYHKALIKRSKKYSGK